MSVDGQYSYTFTLIDNYYGKVYEDKDELSLITKLVCESDGINNGDGELGGGESGDDDIIIPPDT